MCSHPFLSVIIPAHNEESRIGKTVVSIDSHLRNQGYDYEIVVVDDGSNDRMLEVIDSLGLENLRTIHFKKNEGKGWAVRAGVLQARGQYVLFMDADNSTAINNWNNLYEAFKDGQDVVIGSRRVAGSKIIVRQFLIREILGYIFRALVRFIVPVGVADTQNGFKAFEAGVAKELFTNLHTRGWAFDVEVLLRARKLGYKIKEVPVVWINDHRSTVSILGMIQMLYDLMKIRLTLK